MRRLLPFCAAALALSCGDDTSGPASGQDWEVFAIWGSSGQLEGQYEDLYQFAVAPVSSDVYLADWANNRVQYLEDDGTFLGSWAFGAEGRSIAVSQNGIVFVGSPIESRIYMYNLAGILLGGWGESGTGPGQFESLALIRCLPSAAVAVGDIQSDQVQVYDATGTLAAEWTVPDMVYGASPTIDNIALNSSGNLLIFSRAAANVWEYTPIGALVAEHPVSSDVFCIAADEYGLTYLGCDNEPRVRILNSGWVETDTIDLSELLPGEGQYYPNLIEAGDDHRIYMDCSYGSGDHRMVVLAPE